MRRYKVDIFRPSKRKKGYLEFWCGYECSYLEEVVDYIKRFQKDNPTFVPSYLRDVFLNVMEKRDKNDDEVLMNFYFMDQEIDIPMYGRVVWENLDD